MDSGGLGRDKVWTVVTTVMNECMEFFKHMRNC